MGLKPEIVLLPCPFCGGYPRLAEMIVGTPYSGGLRDYTITIECARCGVTLEKEHTEGPDGKTLPLQTSAIDAWNRREHMMVEVKYG